MLLIMRWTGKFLTFLSERAIVISIKEYMLIYLLICTNFVELALQ
jgi:hypothetical protein